MNVYLLDRTVIGNEEEFPRRSSDLKLQLERVPGVVITNLSYRADLAICVIDDARKGGKMDVLTLLQKGMPVWYFFPRGSRVMHDIAIAAYGDTGGVLPTLTLHPITRFFPYDSTSDIASWVNSSMGVEGMLKSFAPPVATKK